jgi:tetratricopeptide (TPR) repeat protein
MDHQDEVIARSTEAIHLNPRDAGAYYSRGAAYREKGEWDRAIADLTVAIQIDPSNALAYTERGNINSLKDQWDLAIADYTVAVGLDPNDAWAYGGRGNAHRVKGELDRAIADYTDAIRLDPKLVWAYSGRGGAYTLKGEHAKADEDCARAMVLGKERPSRDASVLAFLRKAELNWVLLPEQEFAGLSDDDKRELRAIEATSLQSTFQEMSRAILGFTSKRDLAKQYELWRKDYEKTSAEMAAFVSGQRFPPAEKERMRRKAHLMQRIYAVGMERQLSAMRSWLAVGFFEGSDYTDQNRQVKSAQPRQKPGGCLLSTILIFTVVMCSCVAIII